MKKDKDIKNIDIDVDKGTDKAAQAEAKAKAKEEKALAKAKAKEEKAEHYERIQKLAADFTAENGSIICREIGRAHV